MYYQCKRKNCEYMKSENPCLFSEEYVKDERNTLCLAGEDIELEEINEDNDEDNDEYEDEE